MKQDSLNKSLDELTAMRMGGTYVPFVQVLETKHPPDAEPTDIILRTWPDARIHRVRRTSVDDALDVILDELECDISAAPPVPASPRYVELRTHCLAKIGTAMREAEAIHAFWLKDEGHPAPWVWWDFGVLLKSAERSLLILGSASD